MPEQPEMPNNYDVFGLAKKAANQIHKSNDKFPIYFGLGVIVLFLLTASLAPSISKKLGELARGKQGQQSFAQEEEKVLKNDPEASFVSNELLIKVKKNSKGKLKEGNAINTGISSLDKINASIKATKLEKVAKETKKSKSDHDVFSWYKITLEGSKEILKADLRTFKENKIASADSVPEIISLGDNQGTSVDSRITKLLVALNKLKSDPNIESAELNYIVSIDQATSTPSPSPLVNLAVSQITPSSIRYSWIPQAPPLSSLMIWNGSVCKSKASGYNPGDLAWSTAATGNSYIYSSQAILPGKTYCGQIWLDFDGGVVGSNTAIITITGSTPSPTPSPVPSPTPSPVPTPSSVPSPTPPISGIPNDPYYSSTGSWGQTYDDLWGIKKINSEQAWNSSTGSSSVVVAVVDTGVDRNHEDLQGNIWVNGGEVAGNKIDDDGNGFVDDINGWNFYSYNKETMDDYGHGTHVAGTIGAVGNNAKGVVGVNWNVKIMPVKFLGSDGSGSVSSGISALAYAAENGANVINNSWGGGAYQPVDDAVSYAHSLGVTVVSAAGNSAVDALNHSPARSRDTITVSASDINDNIASFSNFGPKIDVGAPGVNILSLKASISPMCTSSKTVGINYCRVSGTSMATPHVAGLAALILSKHPDWKPEEIRQVLRQTSQNPGGEDWSSDFGYGLINAAMAIALTEPPPITRILSPSNANLFLGKPSYTFTVSGIAETRSSSVSWEIFEGVGNSPAVWESKGSGNTTSVNVPITISGETRTLVYKLVVKDPVMGLEGEDRIKVSFISAGPDSEIQSAWEVPPMVSPSGYEDYHDEVGDINGDGQLEIIQVQGYPGKVYAWDINGNLLPGWPADINLSGYFPYGASAAQLEDVDGDSVKEIIFVQEYSDPSWNSSKKTGAFTEKIWVLKGNGTSAAGWPKTIDWRVFGSSTPPVVSDLEGDGTKEIVYYGLGWDFDGQTFTGIQEVNVFSAQGQQRDLWPKKVNLASNSVFQPGFVVSDLDRDGEKEIVVAFDQLTTDGLHQVHAYSPGGEMIAGWPKNFTKEELTQPKGLSVGDLDKDGLQEIVFTAGNWQPATSVYSTYITVLKGKEGSVMSGWPQVLQDPTGVIKSYDLFSGRPILADIDGNGSEEIVFTRRTDEIGNNNTFEFGLNALSFNGQMVLNTPPEGRTGLRLQAAGDLDDDGIDELLTQDGSIFRAGQKIWEKSDYDVILNRIADVDKDGKTELIGFGFDRKMFIILNYSGKSPINGFQTWPQRMHDPQNTNWARYDIKGKKSPCKSFGDADAGGLVTELDAQLVLRADVNLASLTNWQKSVADVNGDLKVDVIDGEFILQYIEGIRTSFPVCVDSDGDGFTDAVENYLGTNPNKACITDSVNEVDSTKPTKPSKTWPADFNAVVSGLNSFNKINLPDLSSFIVPVRRINTKEGDVNYDKRWDLNTDGKIDIMDLNIINVLKPPILDGERALNGPACKELSSVPLPPTPTPTPSP